MTPIEEAKLKVATIFVALAPGRELFWKETLLGDFQIETSLPSSVMKATVSKDGVYNVMLCKGDKALHTLASGSFDNPNYCTMSVSPSDTEKLDSPAETDRRMGGTGYLQNIKIIVSEAHARLEELARSYSVSR